MPFDLRVVDVGTWGRIRRQKFFSRNAPAPLRTRSAPRLPCVVVPRAPGMAPGSGEAPLLRTVRHVHFVHSVRIVQPVDVAEVDGMDGWPSLRPLAAIRHRAPCAHHRASSISDLSKSEMDGRRGLAAVVGATTGVRA